MTRPTSRDDILGRKRDRLAHDPALVDTRRQAALDYLSARAHNSLPQLGGDLTQRFCQRSLAMSLKLDRVDSLEQVPAAGLHVESLAAGHDDLLGITGTYRTIAETVTLMLDLRDRNGNYVQPVD